MLAREEAGREEDGKDEHREEDWQRVKSVEVGLGGDEVAIVALSRRKGLDESEG